MPGEETPYERGNTPRHSEQFFLLLPVVDLKKIAVSENTFPESFILFSKFAQKIEKFILVIVSIFFEVSILKTEIFLPSELIELLLYAYHYSCKSHQSIKKQYNMDSQSAGFMGPHYA